MTIEHTQNKRSLVLTQAFHPLIDFLGFALTLETFGVGNWQVKQQRRRGDTCIDPPQSVCSAANVRPHAGVTAVQRANCYIATEQSDPELHWNLLTLERHAPNIMTMCHGIVVNSCWSVCSADVAAVQKKLNRTCRPWLIIAASWSVIPCEASK